MVSLEDLPASAFPDKPLESGLCLECGVMERMRCSWFCRVECEDAYIRVHNAEGFGKAGLGEVRAISKFGFHFVGVDYDFMTGMMMLKVSP